MAVVLDDELARLAIRLAPLADFVLDDVFFLARADLGSSAGGEGRLCDPIVTDYRGGGIMFERLVSAVRHGKASGVSRDGVGGAWEECVRCETV